MLQTKKKEKNVMFEPIITKIRPFLSQNVNFWPWITVRLLVEPESTRKCRKLFVVFSEFALNRVWWMMNAGNLFEKLQTNILDNINRRLSIEKNKTFENYGKVGNTISASIPIALKDANTKKKISIENIHNLLHFKLLMCQTPRITIWYKYFFMT